MGGGKTFRIVAHDNSDTHIHVRSALLNGRKYTKPYLDFKDIVKGGTLELWMSDQPGPLR